MPTRQVTTRVREVAEEKEPPCTAGEFLSFSNLIQCMNTFWETLPLKRDPNSSPMTPLSAEVAFSSTWNRTLRMRLAFGPLESLPDTAARGSAATEQTKSP